MIAEVRDRISAPRRKTGTTVRMAVLLLRVCPQINITALMKIMAALLNRTQASPHRERIATLSFARERAAAWVWVLARYIPKGRAIILTEISHPLRDTRRKWRLFHERVTAGASLETALPSVGWSIDHEPRP